MITTTFKKEIVKRIKISAEVRLHFCFKTVTNCKVAYWNHLRRWLVCPPCLQVWHQVNHESIGLSFFLAGSELPRCASPSTDRDEPFAGLRPAVDDDKLGTIGDDDDPDDEDGPSVVGDVAELEPYPLLPPLLGPDGPPSWRLLRKSATPLAVPR
jgi:hypothetical protein